MPRQDPIKLECPLTDCRQPLIIIEASGRVFPSCNHAEAQRVANKYNRPIEKEMRDAENRNAAMGEL